METNEILPIQRDLVEKGDTYKFDTSCSTLYITINHNKDNKIIESFIWKSKYGGCGASLEGLGRMTSLALRYNIPLEEILKQLHGIRCPACTIFLATEQEKLRQKHNGELPKDYTPSIKFSCPDTLGRALAKADKRLKESMHAKDIQEKV